LRAGLHFVEVVIPNCITRLMVAMAIAAPALAAPQPWTTVFTQAEFVLDHSERPPGDDAPWQTLRLPHRWGETHPGTVGRGWYRIRFDLPRPPAAAQAIVIAHLRSRWVDFHLNGALVSSSRDLLTSGTGFGSPLFFTIQPSHFRTGQNVMHVRMQIADPIHGLGQVHFGDSPAVRRIALMHQDLNFYMQRVFHAMALAAGLIALFVWFARRADRVMLWFALLTLSWGLAGALWAGFRRDFSTYVSDVLSTYMTYGLPVPAVILALRTVELRWPKLEAVLWAFMAGEILRVYWLLPGVTLLGTNCVLDGVNAVLLLAGAALILLAPGARPGWSHRIEAAALVAMALLLLYEVARFLGWVDVESVIVRPYHVPLMLLAIGATIFERHLSAVRQAERTNVELQTLVDAKTRELEAYHSEREEVLRQQALARERQRILADMHDGVGASLVGLQRYARSGQVDAKVVEQRAREAMQELRIAIDALEPAEGDLGAVLGNLRYRMEPLLESSGVRLAWEVGELPPVEALEPAAVLSIQRILLEAISNALQHSGARHIRLSARPNGERSIEIRVADDGAGYDAAAGRHGIGLGTMRARAHKLGAALEIASRRGEGTTVSLTIPCQLAPA
jgi:signal transduction histidine kinase